MRPHPGQARAADRLRELLSGSYLWRPGAARNLQDPLSFRCVPQTHGACYDAHAYARGTMEVEINAASDNPLVLLDDQSIISVGNFDVVALAVGLRPPARRRRAGRPPGQRAHPETPLVAVQRPPPGSPPATATRACGRSATPRLLWPPRRGCSPTPSRSSTAARSPRDRRPREHGSSGRPKDRGARRSRQAHGGAGAHRRHPRRRPARPPSPRSRDGVACGMARGFAAADPEEQWPDIDGLAAVISSGELLEKVAAEIGPLEPVSTTGGRGPRGKPASKASVRRPWVRRLLYDALLLEVLRGDVLGVLLLDVHLSVEFAHGLWASRVSETEFRTSPSSGSAPGRRS